MLALYRLNIAWNLVLGRVLAAVTRYLLLEHFGEACEDDQAGRGSMTVMQNKILV